MQTIGIAPNLELSSQSETSDIVREDDNKLENSSDSRKGAIPKVELESSRKEANVSSSQEKSTLAAAGDADQHDISGKLSSGEVRAKWKLEEKCD